MWFHDFKCSFHILCFPSHVLNCLIGLKMGNHCWLLKSRLKHKCWTIFPDSPIEKPVHTLDSDWAIEILWNHYGNSPKYYQCYYFFRLKQTKSSTLFWTNDFQLGPWGGCGGWLFPHFDRLCLFSYLPWLHFRPVRCCLHKTHPGVATNILHLRVQELNRSGVELFLPELYMKE